MCIRMDETSNVSVRSGHRKHYFTCQYIGRNLQWLTYGLHNPLVPAKRYKRLEVCIMSHFLSPSPVMVCWENMWRVTAYCVMMRGPSEGGWETDSAQWAVKKKNRGSRKEKRWGGEGKSLQPATGAWNRALRSTSPIIHSLNKELCLSQDTCGWEMTKPKNNPRDRSHQGKERFCEMAFAAYSSLSV